MIRNFDVRTGALAVVASLAVAAIAPPARADDQWWSNPNSVSNLSAQWWQLVFSVPPANNPLTDTTGKKCMVGNRGPVWFLYGNFLGDPPVISRTCTIPQGKQLFVIVYNSFEINTPDICGQVGPLTVEQERADTAKEIATVTAAHVTLDHVSIDSRIVRKKSPVFDGTFPNDNVFNALCPTPGVPGGVYSPGVADGLYALLPPLRVGTHTLHIKTAAHFPQDVTYTLKIVPTVLK